MDTCSLQGLPLLEKTEILILVSLISVCFVSSAEKSLAHWLLSMLQTVF